MNKIEKIIKEFSPKELKLPNLSYSLTANLEDAAQDTIVFYRLRDDDLALEKLKKRLEKSKPALLILRADQEELDINCPYLVLRDESFEELIERLIEHYYPLDHDLKIIGITGTNGKSSCVHLCAQMTHLMGENAYSIGTLGLMNAYGSILDSVGLTTPSRVDLRRMIDFIAKKDKTATIFLEVSSHALSQQRLKGIKLKASGWTNFTQDHLDYHQNLENYFEAKVQISQISETAILYPAQAFELKQRFSQRSDLKTQPIENLPLSFVRKLGKVFQVEHNIQNLSLSVALVEAAIGRKVDLEKITSISLPPGRMNAFEVGDKTFVVDYAHTPDAIKSILQGLRQSFPKNKLTIVFGCGGDRDKTKRPLMREAAEQIADQLVITSDNPRSEEPQCIIDDIMKGAKKMHTTEVDRQKAIEFAFKNAQAGEIILIAGKGHEDYQEFKSGKVPYSDIVVVEEIQKRQA